MIKLELELEEIKMLVVLFNKIDPSGIFLRGITEKIKMQTELQSKKDRDVQIVEKK